MAATINADNGVVSGTSGLKSTADTSGVLALQSNGSTGVTLDTSLNVGIGTSSPASKLHVVGDVRSANGAGTTYMRLSTDGIYSTGTDLYVVAPSGYSNIFYTNNTEKFRIGTAGQFGIGGANYGTSGQVLTSAGSGAAPTWSTLTSAGVNVQTFTSSGTWTKPSLAAGSRVLIQAWGAGGSGSKGTTGRCGGGGGGGYMEKWVTLSSMGSTETITIGAGGAGQSTSGANGNVGGNTTVGSIVTAYGGGGGKYDSYSGLGGGGGGEFSAGSSDFGAFGGGGAISSNNLQRIQSTLQVGGTATGQRTSDAFTVYGGGGGSSYYNDGCNEFTTNGGRSVWGGAGGGSAGGSSIRGTAGTSINGGNGGAAGATGTAGTAPAGGGGASWSGNSGAGGAGQVIITVFPA
jgi:hypothetical protein